MQNGHEFNDLFLATHTKNNICSIRSTKISDDSYENDIYYRLDGEAAYNFVEQISNMSK